jgi:hypothetical protein
MTYPSFPSPTCTFVVRLRPERSPSGLQWRGRIEHVHSRQSAAFCELQGLLTFFQRFGILLDSSAMPDAENT